MGVEGCLSDHICTELPAVAAWRNVSLRMLEKCPWLMKELSSWGLHKAGGARPASQLLPMFTFPPCVSSAAFSSIMALFQRIDSFRICLGVPLLLSPISLAALSACNFCPQPAVKFFPGSLLLPSPMEEQKIYSLNAVGENSPNKSR